MTRMQNLYTGSAGQAAVMSEFLLRGYNVAVPEVDRGDDLFVVEDATGNLTRIQVKAAIGKPYRRTNGYRAQVKVRKTQLITPQTPEVIYVFVFRRDDRWRDFIVISRPALDELHRNSNVGTRVEKSILFSFAMTERTAMCAGIDLTKHCNDFSRWPPLVH